MRQCEVCQASKYDASFYPGLVQPLSIPEEVWVDISIDFITGLSKSHGKDVIFVVVDRLSKYAHFVPQTHPFTAKQVAQSYLDNVFKLHGWPRSIVSNRDAIFSSNFWQQFFNCTVQICCYLLLYNPQTDDQTEAVNRCLETFLRCMCGDCSHEWSM